jgi:hypothetical protein
VVALLALLIGTLLAMQPAMCLRAHAGNISGELPGAGAIVSSSTGGGIEPAIFSDDFEAYGDSSLWSTSLPFPVQRTAYVSGTHAAQITNLGGSPVYGRKVFESGYDRLFVLLRFNVLSLGSRPVALFSLRTTSGDPVISIRIDVLGTISYTTGATGISAASSTNAAPETWHELQLSVDSSVDQNNIRIWLDQVELTTMRRSAWLGGAAMRMLELGDNSAGTQSDIAYDDVIVDDAFVPSERAADPVSGTLTVNTFPAWENIAFELDGRTFYSDASGRATIEVERWSTDLRGRIKVAPSQRGDGAQATFSGWRYWFGPHSRSVYASFRISELVTFAFVDANGAPVDPTSIDSVTIKSNSGVIQTLVGDELRSPVLVNTSSVVPQPTGIDSHTMQYVVDEVMIDGSNVVHRAQQRSDFDASHVWTISLLFYGVTFSARDAFFSSPLGKEVVLRAADGTEYRYTLDSNGEVVIPRLPRGEYTVAVTGGGYAPPRPFLVSRDQVITLEVISRLDMLLLGGTIAVVVAGLLLIGRPFLVTRSVRRTAASAQTLYARSLRSVRR